MDDGSAVRSGGSRTETDAERAVRLRHEAALIAEAEQELADGKGISGRDLDRFLAWFVSDNDGPPPASPDAD
jgi:hypothetical protein